MAHIKRDMPTAVPLPFRKINKLIPFIMEKHQFSNYTNITDEELVKIRGGFGPIGIAALGVAFCKLSIDAAYYIGYTVGYYSVKLENE